MKDIDDYKFVSSICKSIIYENTKCLIVSPNQEKLDKAKEKTLNLINTYNMTKNENSKSIDIQINKNTIAFKNGSVISFEVPKPQSETIRGHRAEFNHWLYDLEGMADDKIITEVLDEYVNKAL